MAAARIAAVFLAAFLPLAGAQQSPKTHLTIQVTDVMGAVVSGARVAIDPSPSPSGSVLMADSAGEAAFDLPAGSYTLSIVQPGFQKWSRKIDVEGAADQMVKLTLEVERGEYVYPGPCCPPVILQPGTGLESAVVADLIPLRPIGNLAPLPSHSPKNR